MSDDPASWTLTLRDFKALEQVVFSPSGVNLLAGSNGSGKSSILLALAFLRRAAVRPFREALAWLGGGSLVRRRGAEGNVKLGFEHLGVKWELELVIEGTGLHTYYGERVLVGDELVVDRTPYQHEWTLQGQTQARLDERSGLRMAMDSGEAGLSDLQTLFGTMGIYPPRCLAQVREPTLRQPPNEQLLPSGENLVHVLHNWKVAPRRHEDRFEWVLTHARRAFPDQISDIEFDVLHQSIEGRFYSPGATSGLPLYLAADGLLTGLLHLTAVAGAWGGGTVAIDELENHLHPHAIRSILSSIRELADERNLTVILTSHSPVLMNEFKRHEDQFFVLESGITPTPQPLDRVKDPDWLAHFSLGDLYDDMDFGAPPVAEE